MSKEIGRCNECKKFKKLWRGSGQNIVCKECFGEE